MTCQSTTHDQVRILAVNTFMTLDGVMQSPGGPDEDPTGGFRPEAGRSPYGHVFANGEVHPAVLAGELGGDDQPASPKASRQL